MVLQKSLKYFGLLSLQVSIHLFRMVLFRVLMQLCQTALFQLAFLSALLLKYFSAAGICLFMYFIANILEGYYNILLKSGFVLLMRNFENHYIR